MFRVPVFETPKEMLDAFVQERKAGDEMPVIPQGVYIVFDGDTGVHLSGEGSNCFDLAPDMTQDDVIEELFARSGIRVHIT